MVLLKQQGLKRFDDSSTKQKIKKFLVKKQRDYEKQYDEYDDWLDVGDSKSVEELNSTIQKKFHLQEYSANELANALWNAKIRKTIVPDDFKIPLFIGEDRPEKGFYLKLGKNGMYYMFERGRKGFVTWASDWATIQDRGISAMRDIMVT